MIKNIIKKVVPPFRKKAYGIHYIGKKEDLGKLYLRLLPTTIEDQDNDNDD